MKYYLIAGERSGDLHAANLMRALKKEDQEAEFRFWGGDDMQKVGGQIVRHHRDLAFMGFLEVVLNLRKIARFLKECKEDIAQYQPDVVILVDYAGFNLRIAKYLKQKQPHIAVHYYISPKVWAWNTKRAHTIKRLVDRMFVIFPFEVAFYEQYDYKVDYVGNPLLDAIAHFSPKPNFIEEYHLEPDKPIIALLPGSRQQEVSKMLKLMLSVRTSFIRYQFVIAAVSNLPRNFYEPFEELANVRIVYDDTYNLLYYAEAALVTSGTATLETALFAVPQVVVYKASPLSFAIAKAVVKVPYISLVNLIAQKEVVRELLQKEANTEALISELEKIVEGGTKQAEVLQDYQKIREKLGQAGASVKTAKLIVRYLREVKEIKT